MPPALQGKEQLARSKGQPHAPRAPHLESYCLLLHYAETKQNNFLLIFKKGGSLYIRNSETVQK